jgi:membrane fusion protein
MLRLTNRATETAQLDQEINLTLRRRSLAQESINKYEILQGNDYVSSAQTQQKQEDLIDIATSLSNPQPSKLQLQTNQLALQAERTGLASSLAADQAQLQRAAAGLQRAASQVGSISNLTSQIGKMINAGQVLATLISRASDKADIEQLEVHLYALSRSAGFVAKGQQVLIQYQAYPNQKFELQKCTVIDISKTPFAPTELPPSFASTILSNVQQNILGFNSNESLCGIKVKQETLIINAYSQLQRLKPGMTLEANALQDRRRIWECVAEPVLAVAHQ